jgi:hypothetical protein
MLSELPTELVAIIVGRLDARAQLRLASTSTRFRGIVAGSPKDVVLCGPSTHAPWHWLRTNAAARTVRSLRAVRASAGLWRNWTGTSGWLARLQALETLSLRFCLASARITESIPPSLRRLHIHRMYGTGIFRTACLAGLQRLESIDIMFAPTWNLVFVDKLPSKLCELRLTSAPQLMVRDGIHGVRVVELHAFDGIVFFASGGVLDDATPFSVVSPSLNRVTRCESLTLHADEVLWTLGDILSDDLRHLDVSCTGLTWVDCMTRLTRLERLTLDLDHVDFSFADIARVAHVRVDARESMTCTDLYVPPPPGGTREVRTRARPVWWCAPPVVERAFEAEAQTRTPTVRQLRRRRAARRLRRPRPRPRCRIASSPDPPSSSSSSSSDEDSD